MTSHSSKDVAISMLLQDNKHDFFCFDEWIKDYDLTMKNFIVSDMNA